jgi:Pyruvate/2-oxoacid:ferredoxin oxidoreductase gamma subunit
MSEDVAVITGRGGQGTKLAVSVLGEAALSIGCFPMLYSIYDGLIRGGKVASTIVVGDEPPNTPIRSEFEVLAALHSGWFERFHPKVPDTGFVFYDPSYIGPDYPGLTRTHAVQVDFSDVAGRVGDQRAANMVAVGVVASFWGRPSLESLQAAVADVTPAHRQDRLDANLKSLEAGWEIGLPFRGKRS